MAMTHNSKYTIPCVVCKLLITSRPKYWCYRCHRYACDYCYVLEPKGKHFYLFEEEPYIPATTIKCSKCNQILKNQFAAFNADGGAHLCNECLQEDEVDSYLS